MKVLLVDDTKTERLIISSYLEKMGHSVVVAENGKQAVSLYHSEKPDLVLMDVIMPEMDGHEAARQMRHDENLWVPIIFLSGRVEPDDIFAGIEAGGDDYLTKPVDFRILEAKMISMTRIAKMRRRLINVSTELEVVNSELKKLANVDGLTGLANRRYLDKYLRVEIARSIRNGHQLAVILCDVDHFKKYNDSFGHLKGDDCLKVVAKGLQSVCKRAPDLVARYGGEEFAVVLPDTSLEDAGQLAQAMCDAVSALKFEHPESEHKVVTISMGVYSDEPEKSHDSEFMLKMADDALYIAKDTGRNKIHLS
ncbi:MAG: diguanylate cyclase response regulator [endosymbiont of Galathealinum brachiosum]|uniref:diguanylate cyclase n=1 Tax=endosymbiont of Galathealinum brachiosum TaxID=2200906 RepID=A0A370DHX3_9GAMM|nr:MAG: diguanylate cyclase response regulator [endosymbiont of Galathealinum brachiosum]